MVSLHWIWLVIIIFLLVLDSVISFRNLRSTLINKKSIIKNTKKIKKLFASNK